MLNTVFGLSLFLVLYFRTYELFGKNSDRFGGRWRARPEVARLVRIMPYQDDAEILVENIIGYHLPTPGHFRGVYVWDLGHETCLWVLSGDAIRRDRPILIHVENPDPFSVTVKPRQVVPLEVRDDMVRIRVPDEVDQYHHPVLGDYLVLRTQGKILGIQDIPALVVRSDTVSEEESLYKAWHEKGIAAQE